MFSVLFKLGWFFKQEKKRYLIAVVLLLLANVTEVLPPWIIGKTIDFIDKKTLTQQLFMEILIFFIALTLIGYVIHYYWRYLLFNGSQLLGKFNET